MHRYTFVKVTVSERAVIFCVVHLKKEIMAVSSFEELILPQLETEMFQITQKYEQKYIDSEEAIKHLEKRSFPTLNVKGTKKRTCQNMNGILGGSNAFNFMSFVAGVITLVSFNKRTDRPYINILYNPGKGRRRPIK